MLAGKAKALELKLALLADFMGRNYHGAWHGLCIRQNVSRETFGTLLDEIGATMFHVKHFSNPLALSLNAN